jgi:SSS family solute:Na+ symporter/sodium/pantothenate symporter
MIFGAYAMTIAIVGWRTARHSRSMQSFAVGTRTTGPAIVGLSLACSLTSAATFVVNPGLVYAFGWSAVVGYAIAAPLGIAVGLLVFTTAFRRIGDEVGALTVPQWIGQRWGSTRLTTYFAALSLLQVSFLVLIVVGLTLVLQAALHVPEWSALIFVVGFTFTYILAGGASTHLITNLVQGIVKIVVAVILLASGIVALRDDAGGVFVRLAAVAPHYASATNPDSALFRDVFEVVIANFVVGIAIILQPHVIGKALMLRTGRDVRVYLGTALSVLALLFAVLLVGLFARLTLADASLAPDAVMATYVATVFPPFLSAVVVVGILAAGFSAMEAILVALSSIVANDLVGTLRPALRADAEAWKIRSMRYAKVFLALLAPVVIWLSHRQIVAPSLSVAIFGQLGVYGLFAATFVPVLFGAFTTWRHAGWAFAASATALVTHFGLYYGTTFRYHNNPAVTATIALGASVAVMLVGRLVQGAVETRVPARTTP